MNVYKKSYKVWATYTFMRGHFSGSVHECRCCFFFLSLHSYTVCCSTYASYVVIPLSVPFWIQNYSSCSPFFLGKISFKKKAKWLTKQSQPCNRFICSKIGKIMLCIGEFGQFPTEIIDLIKVFFFKFSFRIDSLPATSQYHSLMLLPISEKKVDFIYR